MAGQAQVWVIHPEWIGSTASLQLACSLLQLAFFLHWSGKRTLSQGQNTMALKDGSGPRPAAHTANCCFLNWLETSFLRPSCNLPSSSVACLFCPCTAMLHTNWPSCFLLLLLAACHVFLPLAAGNFCSDALPLLQAWLAVYTHTITQSDKITQSHTQSHTHPHPDPHPHPHAHAHPHHLHTHIYICMYIHHIYLYIYIYLYTIYIYIYVHTCVCVFLYTCIYIYITLFLGRVYIVEKVMIGCESWGWFRVGIDESG